MRTIFTVITGVLLLPAMAAAQGETARPRLPRNDTTFSIGWNGGRYDDVGEYDRWHGTLFGGLSAGHYWTNHVKTDVEAGWLSTAHARNYELTTIGSSQAYVSSDYLFKDLKLAVSQSYQFGYNAWVHPYLGAGADIVYRREIEDRPAQFANIFSSNTSPSRTVLVPGERERDTDLRVVPFVKGGFKMYVSDGAFFTQEFKFGLDGHLDHALWKTGVGFDF